MATQSNLARNLACLCRDYPSISSICRQININRQQFNKYLAGAVSPSAFNLSRICAYFDTNEEQLQLPPAEFRRERYGETPTRGSVGRRESVSDFPADGAGQLDRYLGYYFVYYLSPSVPGSMFRSIVRIYRENEFVYSRGMERFNRVDLSIRGSLIGREHGNVSYADDRIYVAERVDYIRRNFSLTVLYPTFRQRLDLLCGVFVSVSSSAGRQPFASRVVYEFMGIRPDLRTMVRQAGIYPAGSPAIREEIRHKCQNALDDDVLRAVDY